MSYIAHVMGGVADRICHFWASVVVLKGTLGAWRSEEKRSKRGKLERLSARGLPGKKSANGVCERRVSMVDTLLRKECT